MSITRRHATHLILAAPAATLLPGALSAGAPEDILTRLQASLQARLDGIGTVTLRDVATTGAPGHKTLAATIRLDWPPGLRQRRLEVSAPTEDDAIDTFATAALDALDLKLAVSPSV